MSEYARQSRRNGAASRETHGDAGSPHPALFVVRANTCDVPHSPVGQRQYEDWPEQVTGGALKRGFVMLIGGVLLVFVSPLLLICAAVVWMQDGAWPFFEHERIGLGGRPFRCIKLRTMVKDGDAKLAHLLATDARARAEWAVARKLDN